MPSYFRIKGLPGLNGLIAVGEPESIQDDQGTEHDVIVVRDLINTSVIIGDRQVKFPMPDDCLYISADCAEEVDNIEIREWTADTPFGDLEYEGHYQKGTIHVDYASYADALTINVKDTSAQSVRTVYSQNYFGDFRVDAEECVERALRDENDIDDLVFDLQAITAAQREHLKKQ